MDLHVPEVQLPKTTTMGQNATKVSSNVPRTVPPEDSHNVNDTWDNPSLVDELYSPGNVPFTNHLPSNMRTFDFCPTNNPYYATSDAEDDSYPSADSSISSAFVDDSATEDLYKDDDSDNSKDSKVADCPAELDESDHTTLHGARFTAINSGDIKAPDEPKLPSSGLSKGRLRLNNLPRYRYPGHGSELPGSDPLGGRLSSQSYLGFDGYFGRMPNSHPVEIQIPFQSTRIPLELTTRTVDECQILRASINIEGKRNTCVYAVDPESNTITFLITRPWSVAGKGMIIGGDTIDFPSGYNYNLGAVIDSGEKTGVWVCQWPRYKKQLPGGVATDVVDIEVEEDDYWFGLD